MAEGGARPRRARWLWVALGASLALNGFFVGLAATDVGRKQLGHHDGERQLRIFRSEIRGFKGRLSPESIATIETALRPLEPDIQARIDRLKSLRAEIDRHAAAPQPDRAAIDDLLREIRLEVGAMQDSVQRATFDALLALPPEARAPLATPREGR